MYQNQLLDAYKQAQNYVQDKQIAHDLNLPAQRVTDFRKGRRYLTDSQVIFLAENAKLDPQVALIGLHADRNDNPQVKQLWEHMAKKFNGLGLSSISMACGGLALWMMQTKEALAQCALCGFKLNESSYITISSVYRPFYNERVMYAPSKNDRKLHFS